MTAFEHLTDDQLADEITTWSGRVAAGEAHLVALLGEFDRREAWGGPGMLSCAHWLSWRTGLGLTAARERVRVARRLPELPAVAAAFAAGRMSWSQVRAMTRVATATDGIDWVGLATSASGAQLERIVRGVRRVHRIEDAERDPERAKHRMRTRTRYDEDGTMVITIRLPAEDGALVLAGLEATQADLDRQRNEEPSAGADPSDDSAEASAVEPSRDSADDRPVAPEAQALVEMARRAVDRQADQQPAVTRRARARLVPQIDPLSGWARLPDAELIPPVSLRAVLATLPGRQRLSRVRPLRPADLTRHDLGRSARYPSLALRELLGCLDGERCRFPGCTRRRRLHAHHVRRWQDGGPTDLGNMVLLCARHHTLVHQQGFRLRLRDDRRLTVATADGVPVLHHPALPPGDRHQLDPARQINARTIEPTHCDGRMDLGYVVSVVLQQAA